ncbi:MAG: carboxypeptidase-like regulatory domain-containing protein, partial [Bacteroidota bacterium]
MKNLLLSLLFSLILSAVFGQKTIGGQIIDAATSETLAGVNIQIKGTDQGTTSDLEGQFQIELNEEENILLISYVGYETQEVTINSDTKPNLLIALRGGLELEELVVTALGLERSSKDLGYVVQNLDAEQISEIKSPNFIDNLAGKLAGVTISQGATGVGSTSKITIRGEASFTNNNPLFVVDGTPINNNSILNFTNEAAAGFQEIDFGNGAMEVNADDIASVSVLK